VTAVIVFLLFRNQRDGQLAEIRSQGVSFARVLSSVPFAEMPAHPTTWLGQRELQLDDSGSYWLIRINQLGAEQLGGSRPPLATNLFNNLRRFQTFPKKPLREFCVT